MTRARELAVQAWRRIQTMGRDPVESIQAAIVQAIDDQAACCPQLDRLCPTQRAVALAMWGGGDCSIAAIAARCQVRRGLVSLRLLRLRAAGMVERVGWGRWRLRIGPKAADLPRQRRAPDVQRALLTRAHAHGQVRLRDVIAATKASPRHCQATCGRLCAQGLLVRLRYGVYGIPTPGALSPPTRGAATPVRRSA